MLKPCPSAPYSNMSSTRIYLSPPHMSGLEQQYVAETFVSNWIAPLGPQVDAFEREFAAAVGAPYALALSSGTAALHLALLLAGVGRDDEVFVSSLTFSASANPIVYLGGRPVFVDSEPRSWNMDPALLSEALDRRAQVGRLPKAVILVHLYGQSADIAPIEDACERHGITLIEDAAEALGATYRDRAPGSFGWAGIYSFNGNKIITTSGGGMLVSSDKTMIDHARKLSTQAREPAPHYQHEEIGYNYRLSNVLAAIGRGQLQALPDRVAARRRNFDYYCRGFVRSTRYRVYARSSVGKFDTLADLHHSRSCAARRRSRGHPDCAGEREYRGPPCVEADAPPARIQGLRAHRRGRGRRPVRARTLFAFGLKPV